MVIERALQLELDEEEEGFSMSSLRQALPQDEEHHFHQVIHYTICLNSGQFLYTDKNQREERQFRNRRNNNLYSVEEDQEDKDY